jgi:hypothetical protein
MDVSLKTHSGVPRNKEHAESDLCIAHAHYVLADETVYAKRASQTGARGYAMKQEPGEVLVVL